MHIRNADAASVKGFGNEWARFDQRAVPQAEINEIFAEYFSIFPWPEIPANAQGFDLGCGSGRWSNLVARRVGHLHCIDASIQALEVARRTAEGTNCSFHLASVESMPLGDGSQDFGYSLGVLHHVPDTEAALRACALKLKLGAPFLVYLYYAFDNRPFWFRALWHVSNVARHVICRLPFAIRARIADCIAALLYWPLARLARLVETRGGNVRAFPLSYYRTLSFYTMRTDALDRFGTHLEKRFKRREIAAMLSRAGFHRIVFREGPPYWCALGNRMG
ncbi:MAG TPA: class I SAM-dependent methyltransferase [Steroidobacteraceae bacterium]